jgi:hypothetical protein
MAVIQTPNDNTLATVDPTMKSMHASIKPDDAVGAFRIASTSGAVTVVAGGGTLFSFRFAPGTGQLCVLKRITVTWNTTTGYTAGQIMGFGLFFARSFLASDSGGTALGPILGSNQKFRTRLNTSQVTDVRMATTAALTAGTRTLDSQALGSTYFYSATTTVGSLLRITNLLAYSANDYPFILQNNEGFVINNLVTMGAGGVGTLSVNVEWFETDAYKASVNT